MKLKVEDVYIVIILIYKREPSNGNSGACMASYGATEPTKYAEIIEDEDTNIRRRKVTDTNM